MSNKIVHFEVMGPDDEQLAFFYGDLFGWQPAPVEGFETYRLVDKDHAGLGGAVGKGSDDMTTYLTMYIEVDSIDDHLARIKDAGGQVVLPRTVLPGMVTYALFRDPAGNVVGLVEADVPSGE